MTRREEKGDVMEDPVSRSPEPEGLAAWKRGLLVVVSSIVTVLAMPPFRGWYLGFVALVPLYAAVLGLGFRWTCRVGFLWGILVAAGTTPWFWVIFGGSAGGLWALMAFFWGLSLGL